jgi:hypothetical protein
MSTRREQQRIETERVLAEWIGSSRWRGIYALILFYGARVILSICALGAAWRLRPAIPSAFEVSATVVVLLWTHLLARQSERFKEAARKRERAALQRAWPSPERGDGKNMTMSNENTHRYIAQLEARLKLARKHLEALLSYSHIASGRVSQARGKAQAWLDDGMPCTLRDRF